MKVRGELRLRVQIPYRKRQKYKRRIEAALWAQELSAEEASKLASWSNWAASLMWGRVGKAFLWPIYNRANRQKGQTKLTEVLQFALEGLWHLLDTARAPLYVIPKSHAYARLYTDATLDWVCGVFFPEEGVPEFFAVAVADLAVEDWLEEGNDFRIAQMELLALLVAVTLWARVDLLRQVLCYIDNETAHAVVIKGYSSMPYLDCMAAQFWLEAHRCGWLAHLDVVASLANCADDGTRGRAAKYLQRGWLDVSTKVVVPDVHKFGLFPANRWGWTRKG